MFAVGTSVLFHYSRNKVWSGVVRQISPVGYYGAPDYLVEFDGIVVPADYADGSGTGGPQGGPTLRLQVGDTLMPLVMRAPQADDDAKRADWVAKRAAFAAKVEAEAKVKADALFAAFKVGARVSWTVDNTYMNQGSVDTHHATISAMDRATMMADLEEGETAKREWLGRLTLVA